MSASREKKKRQEQVVETVSAPETKKGMSKTVKNVLTAVIAIVLIAAIVFLGMVSSGFFTTHTTAGVANGHKLTPAMLNYYYGAAYEENATLLQYMADTELPLSEQAYITEDYATWHDYLVDLSLSEAATVYAIYDEAVANGFTMSEDAKSTIETEVQMLQLYASMSGLSSADAYIASIYGKGCDIKSYQEYATVNYTAQEYVNSVYSAMTFDQAELDAYYAENADQFDSISYHQYLVSAEGTLDEDNKTVYSDEALAAAEQLASEVAEAGKGDEQAFLNKVAELDAEATTLHEDVAKASVSEALREWLSDPARQYGDTTYIFNDVGSYYVLFYLNPVDHNYALPNVRHILVEADPEDATAMEIAKADAESLLQEFQAGTATEDAFAALATDNTDDTGSAANGGLYENITPGSMVSAFNDWCFDEARQIGDTGIVVTEYGYHVMYFSGYGENYHNYEVNTAMVNAAYSEWQSEIGSTLTWELLSDKYVAKR